MKVKSYRDLDVWRKALEWVEQVYVHTAKFPPDERFGMTSQLRRAAISVPSNIAEGAERLGTREFVQFIGVARGSLAEAETLLLLARKMCHLSPAAAEELLERAAEIGRMLNGLRRSLETDL